MNKIYAFVITIPLIFILVFKVTAVYEYDTKQRYIKDLLDSAAYNVKITGVFTEEDLTGLRDRLEGFARFDSTEIEKCILIKKGIYLNGEISNLTDYIPGERLQKGDAFLIYVKSSEVCNYSKIQNGGRSIDDSRNLYYKAKTVCRIEYNE